ncbi:GW dipeptide domain-containing protein [Geopsychrobacter electrodiphilus]|uniref:GW dipeptide domain-containing protein n=1 Tax=Geopsychrobacter electrodiphilus TaxID=225196 RepID=UPI0003708D4D|nr:GW dipeptide domain-containing protein [Geopsychrobacter electrodiphilus]
MKRILVLLVVSISVMTLSACSKKDEAPKVEAPAAAATTQAPVAAKAAGVTGKVVETMNAAGYTYVQVDDGTKKVWAAAPEFKVSVGDNVIIPEGMPMKNYHSKSLGRDFDVVYFVDSILNPNAPAAAKTDAKMPEGHPNTQVASTPPVTVDLKGIAKAKGGMTVAEVNTDKAALAGKEVAVRGKVVKYNAQIMGKNWLHIQDGTGDAAKGSNDITVTSTTEAKVGDTVLVSGKVTLDKDFGYGYKYALIIEDAKVTVEK